MHKKSSTIQNHLAEKSIALRLRNCSIKKRKKETVLKEDAMVRGHRITASTMLSPETRERWGRAEGISNFYSVTMLLMVLTRLGNLEL